jgi:hypothetical protein
MILRDFDKGKVCGGLSGYLRQEFRNIDILDEITSLQYNGLLPPGIVRNLRVSTINAYRSYKEEHGDSLLVETSSGEGRSQASIDSGLPQSIVARSTPALKRKSSSNLESRKKVKLVDEHGPSIVRHQDVTPTVHAPWVSSWKWDADDWSCAFDSFLTVLRSIWYTDANFWTGYFDLHSEVAGELGRYFGLVESGQMSLEEVRVAVRSKFWDNDPESFPRGRHATNLYSMIQVLLGIDARSASRIATRRCKMCLRSERGLVYDGINKYVLLRQESSVPCSISEYMISLEKRVGECSFCGGDLTASHVYSPIIAVQLPLSPPGESPVVSIDTSFAVRGGSYWLAGVIYHGDLHFASRIVDQGGRVYIYDGMLGGGRAAYEGRLGGSTNHLSHLAHMTF